jgi:spore germination protein KC
MMNKKIGLLLVTFLSLAGLTGCWDRQEPEQLAMALAVGFDLDEKTGDFKVIAQIANPQGMGGQGPEAGGGGGPGEAVWVVAASGETPFMAVRNLIPRSTRIINFTHTSVCLFSEELARQGLESVTDLLDRNRQFRLVAHPLVVEGDLRKALEADFALEEIGAMAYLNHQLHASRRIGVTREVRLRDVYNNFTRPGWETVIPRLHLLTDEEGNMVGEAPVEVTGLAAFKGDTLVGWLDRKETRGLNWAHGKINRAIYVLPSPLEGEKPSTVEIFQASSRMQAEVKGDQVTITLEIQADGRLQETLTSREWLGRESEFTRSLDRRLAQAIRNDVRAALDKAQQEFNSDIFCFGNLLYRTRPRDWQRLSGRWDEIFPRVQVNILVDANVRRTGLIKDPMKIRGGT